MYGEEPPRTLRLIPSDTVTGFLHPGAMGVSLAAACHGTVLWCSDGRSEATRARARDAGLEEVRSLDEMAARAEVIVSVCPPSSATDVAAAVAATGFDRTYVDANAVSPATARSIGRRFANFVDGGIVGPPAHTAGTTRLYLSGPGAASVAKRWEGSLLEPRVIDGGAGAASALKICYATWTKGTSALVLAIRALASSEGVDDALLAEWATSIPGLVEQSELAAVSTAPKAWRFVGEMEEIAATFAAQGLPEGFGVAAADVYRRLAGFKDTDGASAAEAIAALLGDRAS